MMYKVQYLWCLVFRYYNINLFDMLIVRYVYTHLTDFCELTPFNEIIDLQILTTLDFHNKG